MAWFGRFLLALFCTVCSSRETELLEYVEKRAENGEADPRVDDALREAEIPIQCPHFPGSGL